MSHARNNQHFELFCSASGKPAPRIIWTAGDEVIKPGRDFQVVTNGTTSKLGKANLSQSQSARQERKYFSATFSD